MFRHVLMGTLVCYASCFTQISTLPILKSRSVKYVCKMQKKDIDPRSFNDIDKDKSGSIDITELNSYYGKNNYMEVADMNNDNMIDYPEFERLANINKFGKQNGGNLFVRNAINWGLLDKNSILADGEASILVGNKGFDPLNCSVDISTLKKYAKLKLNMVVSRCSQVLVGLCLRFIILIYLNLLTKWIFCHLMVKLLLF